MKKTLFLLLFPLISMGINAKQYKLVSPNGKLTVTVNNDKNLTYSLSLDGQQLIAPSQIALTLDQGKSFGENATVQSVKTTTSHGTINALFYKKKVVGDHYNQLALKFRQGFTLIFRAYDEGVAYRFVSDRKREVVVKDEKAEFNFAKDWPSLVPYTSPNGSFENQFNNSFESTYTQGLLSQLKTEKLAFLPFMVEADHGVKICVTEADLENYPGMYVNRTAGHALRGVFAKYPKEVRQEGHNKLQLFVKSRENYLVKATAKQQFPWRVINVSTDDRQLLDNDMVYRLASPSRISSTEWIKPGKVAWDWWNDWGLYKVPFKAGVNTQTYKAYIDFASKHGIEYVILDEGWAVNLQADLFQVVPEIDLKGIVDYAKQKNVGIILWAGYYAFARDMERVCRHYSDMGVKGFKIDFMDRDDAACVNFLYDAARMAAKYRMLVDFHGIFKPTGLQRTYPNVINFEGVKGQENTKWSSLESYNQVQYDVQVPFIRMLAGQMDYTQGAMLNSTKETFHASNSNPMSQGTRCHQLAMYTVFFSPLNMLCDSPTHYEEEPECTEFIAKIPVVWDQSVALTSKVGEYVTMARRSGNTWYVGVINNWTARDLTIDLSPLGDIPTRAEAYFDGANATKFAQDYVKKTISIPSNKQFTVHLAPGGGFTMKMN